ncbi:hypothetical protein SCUP515_12638 [Seiridium cupressi]
MDEIEGWTERHDVDIINEEQGPLLQLHEELVAEFGGKALSYLESGPDSSRGFPDFWSSYWIVRIREVLEDLDDCELNDAERRSAEDIGVQWCKSAVESEKPGKDPYDYSSLEYYFYELDLICPEYNEPWPAELREAIKLP